MLEMYVDVEHKTWSEILPYATFSYNKEDQEATAITPFQLVYGRTVSATLDSMLPVHEDEEDIDVN